MTCADAAALAYATCPECSGTGTRETYRRDGRRVVLTRGSAPTCPCVYRRAFRVCLGTYRACGVAPDLRVTRERVSSGGYVHGFRRAEYAADFAVCGARELADDAALRGVFNEHFLRGDGWRVCCRRLRADRGAFFHGVYRVEVRLGRAFLDLKPYGLFPRDYFAGRWAPQRAPHQFGAHSNITLIGWEEKRALAA